jgi:hypothetical protein
MHSRKFTYQLGDEESPTTTIERRLRTCRVMAVSCAFSVAIYGLFVAGVVSLAANTVPRPDAGGPALRWSLYGLALGAQLMAYAVLRLLPKPGQGVEQVSAHLQTRTVLLMAFSEVPAVFGVLLFLMRGTTEDFAVLGTLSLVLIALRWPSQVGFEERCRQSGLLITMH